MTAYNPDAVVQEFFRDQGGELFLVSDDDFFVKNVRSVFQKTLGLKDLHMEHLRTLQAGLAAVLERSRLGASPLVMVERHVNRKSSSEFIRGVTGAVPGTRVLCLATETERASTAFLHEIGAGGILTKPASANDIIEKTASLVKPPEELARLLGEARRRMNAGQYEQAIELCDKVMAIKPGSPGMLMIRGESLMGLGRREEGLECLVKAHENSPMYLDPLLKLVHATLGRDDARARHWLKKLDAISPRNQRRKFDLGRVSARLGDADAAARYFRQAVALAREESPAIVNQVTVDIAEVLPEESLALGQELLSETIESKGRALGLDDMVLFNRLGLNLRRQGKWSEAVECYRRALEIAPDDEGLYYNIAMALFEGNQRGAALAQMDAALKRDPNLGINSRNISMNIGRVYQAAGRSREAVAHFERALELSPGDEEIEIALAGARRAAA
jgi:tetratricopeptide (TPR) repeat protein